jgi:PAS domain-containing protein
MNQAAAKIMRCSIAELIGKKWGQLSIRSEIAANLKDILEETLNTRRCNRATVTVTRDDRKHFYEYSVCPIQHIKNNLPALLLVMRDVVGEDTPEIKDITTRDGGNEYDETRSDIIDDVSHILKLVFESSTAKIAYLNNNYEIVMANREFIKDFNTGSPTPIGRNYFDVFPNSEDREVFSEVMQTGETIKRKIKSESIVYGGQRRVNYWNWTITPIKENSSGEDRTVGIVISINDITRAVKSKEFNDTLNDISASVRTTYDMEKIVRLAAVKASKALCCDYTTAVLKKNNRWIRRYLFGRTRKPGEFISDESSVYGSSITLKENNNRLDITVPLLLQEDIIGKLEFRSCTNEASCYQMIADFISRLGTTISMALENSILYESKRQIADTLQEALLTIPKKISRIEFCHLYHSASEAARVGGDFYDVFSIDEHKIGLIIGDVSGKGLDAAALTSVVKNTIKAYAMEHYSPAIVIEKTNNVIRAVTDISSFVSVIFAVLDTKSEKIIYCNAGHPTAIIKRNDDLVLLEANSPIVGAFDGLEFNEHEYPINKDDLIIMYTDGLTEARLGQEFFGESKLVSFISDIKKPSVHELPNQIFEQIMKFTNGVLSDDLALLAVAPNYDA